MGCCFSCRSSASTIKNNIVRVVHLNGYVEDFDHPVSVSQLIITSCSNLTKHFVCTPAQLLSNCSKPMLKPDKLLEPGHVYLLLPYSTLQADVSPVDLASLVRKLTAKSKSKSNTMREEAKSVLKAKQDGSSKARQSWRPTLDTIRERSFSRQSESDLARSEYLETLK